MYFPVHTLQGCMSYVKLCGTQCAGIVINTSALTPRPVETRETPEHGARGRFSPHY